jgi:hypothetical protein
VDSLYLGEYDLCEEGFKYLSNYEAVECLRKRVSIPDSKRWNVRGGIFRSVKADNWNSSSCEDKCLDTRGKEETVCHLSCMRTVEIDELTNPYSYEYITTQLTIRRLYFEEQRIVDKDSFIMATVKNYTYYPQWNILSKLYTVGGLVHTGAPKLSCEESFYLDKDDVYRPKQHGE